MRVLDIDLDFFLADCCELAEPDERPALTGCEPWQPERVRAFLEENCGLSTFDPIPGRVFRTHDGALRLWQELIAKEKLTVPFSVTHVDAHSDLGIGKPGPGFVLNSVLPILPCNRADIERYYRMKQLDEANYLLFALAFRWIERLENVRSPKSRPDIPPFALKCETGEYESIRLSSFTSALFEAQNGKEPMIPFTVYSDYSSYHANGSFDFVSLAISPRYSPMAADALIPIIAEYISQI